MKKTPIKIIHHPSPASNYRNRHNNVIIIDPPRYSWCSDCKSHHEDHDKRKCDRYFDMINLHEYFRHWCPCGLWMPTEEHDCPVLKQKTLGYMLMLSSNNNYVNIINDYFAQHGLTYICNTFPRFPMIFDKVSYQCYEQQWLINLFNRNFIGEKAWLFMQMIHTGIILPFDIIYKIISSLCALMRTHHKTKKSVFKTQSNTLAGKLLLIKYSFATNLPTDVINHIISIDKEHKKHIRRMLLPNRMVSNGETDWNGGLYRACMGDNLDVVAIMISNGLPDWKGETL